MFGVKNIECTADRKRINGNEANEMHSSLIDSRHFLLISVFTLNIGTDTFEQTV